MATKLENIIQHALRTFKRPNIKILPEPSQNDFAQLKALTDDITIKDIKIPKRLLQKSESQDFLGNKFKTKVDPIDYLSIYEDSDVSIGVFVLKQGAKLPIHDHPCMYGIIKVLHGIVKITNYSFMEIDTNVSINSNSSFYKHALKTIKHPENTVTESDSSCTLTPTERSIHEVECLSGPAAFLDILAPPYDDDITKSRGCHYFEEIAMKDTSDDYVRLMEISNPCYWATPNEER